MVMSSPADWDGLPTHHDGAPLQLVTIDDVRRRAKEIDNLDNATAHAEEDRLHADVLFSIAQGAANPGELAAWALTTLRLRFARWYE